MFADRLQQYRDAVSWLTGLRVSSCSYKVSPADLTDLHVIRYELERDLMPLVLSNTQYSIERGQETLHEYDLPKIQQQIVSRFLLGKPLITLNVSKFCQKKKNFFFFSLKIVKIPCSSCLCPFSTGHSNTCKQTGPQL